MLFFRTNDCALSLSYNITQTAVLFASWLLSNASWTRAVTRLFTSAVNFIVHHTSQTLFLPTLSFSRFHRFSQKNWHFSALPVVNCHDHSLLLSSYLSICRIKWENIYCSACGHHLQDLTHRLLDFSTSEPLRRAIFGTTSSIFYLWSRPWEVARLLGLDCTASEGRGRVALPPTLVFFKYQ